MNIKAAALRILLGARANSETYIRHLRKAGMAIGDRTIVYEPRTVCIDETRPCLISIGNDVKITRGVTILTHGYDWSVLAGMHDVVLGSAGAVKVGNNVFIGANTTILKGVTIGNNVVIGAGSLVNKDIPDNCVAGGSPARVIMSIDDYFEKRKNAQIKEACELFRHYVDRFQQDPPMEVFDEFFFLFWRKEDELPERFKLQMGHHGRFEQTYENLMAQQPIFDGYEAFLDYAKASM